MITEQALDIANSLIVKGIIPAKAAEDALHIAIATVNAVDYLLTLSRHIANPEIQRGIAAHLEDIGLSLPFIFTPKNYLEKKMWIDEIVDEVRAVRDTHAAKFGYDLQAIYADLKKSEAEHIAAGHPFIPTPERPALGTALQRTRFAQR